MILGSLVEYWAQWSGVAVGAFGIAFTFFLGALKRRDSLRFLRFLNWAPGRSVYSRVIGAALDRVDRWLTPEDVQAHPKPYPNKRWYWNVEWLMSPRAANLEAAERVGGFAWGWTLMDKALLFAFLYPAGLLVVVWAVMGGEGRIGALVVLSDDVPIWTRWVVVASLTLIILSRMIGRDALFWLGSLIFFAAFGLTEELRSGGAVAFAFAVAV
ncbi:MAG: hypothetical protein HQ481_11680, partial [Alphaproteobacteria bacterium]|nr:hypothetical protein [Alphaproteobacteria bacterium]